MRDDAFDPALVRLTDLALAAPRLPSRRWLATSLPLAVSTALHVGAALTLLVLADRVSPRLLVTSPQKHSESPPTFVTSCSSARHARRQRRWRRQSPEWTDSSC